MPILKSDNVDEKKLLEEILKRENLLEVRRQELDLLEKKLKDKENDLLEKLAQITKITPDEARKEILNRWQERLQKEIANEIRYATEKAKEESKKKVREILIEAMQHAATDYIAEYTVSVVKVPDEEMKGRIIGKEGRNIRAFEKVTGVDVDLDEEGVIRLSSFDSVRREIARVALEELIKDGRIQPVRIEEIVEQVKKNIEEKMYEEGEALCHRVGVYNLPKELIALLGRFKYRFSYGQNMIAHTLEETKIGIKIAHEVGANVNIVKLGCLLHDIGKIVADEEGNHVELGVSLLKKYNLPKEVVDTVAAHHEDIPFPSLEAVIVYIADSISGGRPGARYTDYEEYVKRLKDIEEIAKSFSGVTDVYALQAGREIRVIVDSTKLDDAQTMITAQKIKEKIAQKMSNFPGTIKITLIREVRVSESVK